MDVTIYTDGSTETNPGLGAWAAIILYNDMTEYINAAYRATTNNRMEIRGVLHAIEYVLENLGKDVKITVYSDSQYCVNAINSWFLNWQSKGLICKNSRIKNVDLLVRLHKLCTEYKITMNWIKGHQSNKYNNLCDVMAKNARNTAILLDDKEEPW
jgi:ribonuclease HI